MLIKSGGESNGITNLGLPILAVNLKPTFLIF